ncbi:hypothetical protein ACH5RR_023768 [Cinchona calisaya]|uniref:Uncharacterized protein n=1 Tax=Cinchona calisaya TaxID=153742 RepID=A0ABD2ZDG8_9GENT
MKLANYGSTIDPNSLYYADAQKGSNLNNATFFQGGKQVKVKAKRFSSNGSYKKNFKRTPYYKGLSPESSPKTRHTISFMDLTDQTAGPSAVNEPASKVLSPIPIDPELSVKLVMDPDDTQITKVSLSEDILLDNQM